MSQTHRHTIYFWCGVLAVIALLLLTLYKLNIAIERSRSIEEINTQLALIKDHKTASRIIEARNILKEIEVTKATEFKEAQALCMKDVEAVKPSKEHTFIYQVSYCRDRSIKYMGYEYEYKDLKQRAVQPIPSSIKIIGAL